VKEEKWDSIRTTGKGKRERGGKKKCLLCLRFLGKRKFYPMVQERGGKKVKRNHIKGIRKSR